MYPGIPVSSMERLTPSVNTEETINKTIPLHNYLKPVDIRVLVNEIRNIDIFRPIA
jgi:hypothetical protein